MEDQQARLPAPEPLARPVCSALQEDFLARLLRRDSAARGEDGVPLRFRDLWSFGLVAATPTQKERQAGGAGNVERLLSRYPILDGVEGACLEAQGHVAAEENSVAYACVDFVQPEVR